MSFRESSISQTIQKWQMDISSGCFPCHPQSDQSQSFQDLLVFLRQKVYINDQWLKSLAFFEPSTSLLFFRPCPTGFVCLPHVGDNPNYGFTSFDNLLWSMLTTFQLITLDYWENVYNMVSYHKKCILYHQDRFFGIYRFCFRGSSTYDI